VRTRLSFDPDTLAYAARSRARGKTNREIRRTLLSSATYAERSSATSKRS